MRLDLVGGEAAGPDRIFDLGRWRGEHLVPRGEAFDEAVHRLAGVVVGRVLRQQR